MHKTHYVNGLHVAQLLYKNYCNVSTKTKTTAKKLYYHQKLGEYHNNPKKIWDILRTLLRPKSASKVPNCVSVNNASITDPAKIANEFNDHFTRVGKSLEESFDDHNSKNFLTYLKTPCISSIYMLPSTPQEVCMAINSLKLNKASGNDDILPFFLKMATQIIASPLLMLINSCFTYGIFPNKLKLAKVVPVFKKGHSKMLNNYRPISLLPSLSKLIERLICNRLWSFFTRNNTIVYS